MPIPVDDPRWEEIESVERVVKDDFYTHANGRAFSHPAESRYDAVLLFGNREDAHQYIVGARERVPTFTFGPIE